MKDILLWQLLLDTASPPEAEALLPLLQELAQRDIKVRFPFLGVLGPALDHADATVRAEAIRCLRGANGIPALRRIVQALDDPDTQVRLAAVEALAESTSSDSARFVHALFHPQPDVRQHAVAQLPQGDDVWYPLLLLPDEATRTAVTEAVRNRKVPVAQIATVMEFAGAGLLPTAVARQIVSRMPLAELLSRAVEADRKDAQANARSVLRVAESAEIPNRCTEEDFPARLLEQILDLFWDEPLRRQDAEDDQEAAAVRGFYPDLARFVAEGSGLGIVVAAGVVRTAVRRGGWCAGAAGVCILAFPRFLGFDWVPAAVRRDAVAFLYKYGRDVKHGKEFVEKLIGMGVCRRPSGRPDLWVIGGLLHFLRAEPYKTLQEWLTLDEIVAAAHENLDEAVAFLSLEDRSEKGQSYLITEIVKGATTNGPSLMGMMACASATERLEKLEFLQQLDGPTAVQVACEVIRLAQRHETKLSERKTSVLGQMLGTRIGDADFGEFLRVLLSLDEPHRCPIGMAVFETIVRQTDTAALTPAALSLGDQALRRLLVLIAYCPGFPYGKEVELARAVAEHSDPEVAAWAQERVPAAGEPAPAQRPVPTRPKEPPSSDVSVLAPSLADAIASCPEGDLDRAIEPVFLRPCAGLCAALGRRPPPSGPLLNVARALLVCHDPLDLVAEQFSRFGAEQQGFLSRLDRVMAADFEGQSALSLLANAWLSRWDKHCFAFGEEATKHKQGLAGVLDEALHLGSPAIRYGIWTAAGFLLGIWRWREPKTFPSRCTDALLDVLIDALKSDVAELAAERLDGIYRSRAVPDKMAALKGRVRGVLCELTEQTRRLLSEWVDSAGLVISAAPTTRAARSVQVDLDAIGRCNDIAALSGYCGHESVEVVQRAAWRLLELGEEGLDGLLAVVTGTPAIRFLETLAELLVLWPEGRQLVQLRRLIREDTVPPHTQFWVGLGLVARGDKDALADLLRSPIRPSRYTWFKPPHWDRLLAAGIPEDVVAVHLALSPHPPAYMPAVDAILTHPHPDDAMEQALVGFLAADSERAREHRLQAAWWLCRRGNWSGFPVLLKDLAVEGKLEEEHPKEAKRLLALAPGRLVEVSVEAFLFGGSGVAAEEMVVTRLLGRKRTDPELVTECARRLLVDCSLGKTRNAAVQILRHCDSRHTKLRQVADAFAWGVRTGRELTGKLFKVEMHGGRELGFTFLQGTTVYITPLPLIQGERHGRDVVEGLILHEIGHHLYHRENDVWVEAEKEQVHSLLNLAADEHLERRLRVVDPVFGDRFKRLAAHAFQHSAREVDVDDLLNCLCGRAFGVLTAARLGVARAAGHVRVDNGSILVALERAGLSLPRFIRALRMGLGNRHGDEKVALGLALFSRGFRDKDTAGLLETARELRRIFGVEAALLELFSQDMSLLPGEGEVLIRGEGITDDELQTEIDRILNPRTRSATKGRGRGGRFMNLSDDERFERISNVVRLPYDRSRYAVYAARVARNARRMRQYFEELGLAYEPRRFRVRGKSVDRARLQALVLRGDPRVLVARELRVQTDLFLGVLVDCSGSMATNERIERAKHFAILLAEAARGMQRVSLRVFGFTDSVIFDAGDARRCAAAALESEGGNNDAAALWHAAQAARRSRRKARLLVMISDGSPTECSTGALKALVRHLSRRERICCAQVAVRPIDVVCFPHYVEIESQETGEAVRRFGKLIVDLVQKTISK